MTNGKSVKEMASAVVASVGYRTDPEAAIAAALQDVADKCAGICESQEVLISWPDWETRKKVSAATANGLADAIRAAFPRGTDE
jgi:hypothetical protein